MPSQTLRCGFCCFWDADRFVCDAEDGACVEVPCAVAQGLGLSLVHDAAVSQQAHKHRPRSSTVAVTGKCTRLTGHNKCMIRLTYACVDVLGTEDGDESLGRIAGGTQQAADTLGIDRMLEGVAD